MRPHRLPGFPRLRRLPGQLGVWARNREWLPDRADVRSSVQNGGLPRLLAAALGLLAFAAVLVAVGVTLPSHGTLAIAVAIGVLLIGVTVVEPATLPVLAMPAFVVVDRIGGGGVDLSISDFALFAVFWLCLLLGGRPYSRPMRSMLWVSAVYQLATLFTVLIHFDRTNVVEWLHAWLLVAGALVVGWAIGRRGAASMALAMLMAMCAFIAVTALVSWVRYAAGGQFGPVYLTWPWGIHKNSLGTTLAFVGVIAYARPRWLGWPRPVTLALFWVFTAGVAVSQSRQAYIALAIGILVVLARSGTGVRHSPWILVPVLVAVVVVVALLRDQIEEDNPFNSTYQRLTWFQQAIAVWSTNQAFGVGLRWWTTGRFPYAFQPPNAELEVLSSAGVVGLVGFVVLAIGSLVVLWRVRPDYGTVAFAVVLTRYVQGQFDLFWVAVSVSIPYLVAGICLGAAARADESPPEPVAEEPAREPTPGRQRALAGTSR